MQQYTLTADGRQFVVSLWTVCDSITNPVLVDASSVCASVVMTLASYMVPQKVMITIRYTLSTH